MEPFYSEGPVELYVGDCLQVLTYLRERGTLVDLVFADPPYFLSNGGVTCRSGRMVSVDKGRWDRSRGVEADHHFHLEWLQACRAVMRPDATIWVSGTMHVIHSVGYAMQRLGFKLLNEIVWFKVNPPPNLSTRYFTHSHELLLWAALSQRSRHTFHYQEMKAEAGGRQMKSLWPIVTEEALPETVWAVQPPRRSEKQYAQHPTQKPLALLERIVRATSNPGDLVLDPFSASGTTGVAAVRLGRRYIGIEIDQDYAEASARRLRAAIAEPVVS